MFDSLPMKTLRQYIESAKPTRTHEEWAAVFGISRSYFTDIVNERVTPGTKVIKSIAQVTGGKVSPAVWFRPLSIASGPSRRPVDPVAASSTGSGV